MEKNSRLYVHCGLHKTGSTALQSALRANEGALRQAGFLYPYAGSLDQPGRINPEAYAHAHRNIGFEIDQHWLFRPQYGALSDLEDEIKAFSGHVIISVEGLESVLAQLEKFSRLRRLARNMGRRLTIVLYLRSQISYAESLYQELLKHYLRIEYSRYVEEILETGIIRNQEAIHHFDYEKALSAWEGVADADVIVRNYHALAGGSVVTDFARLLGVEGVFSAPAGGEKINAREGFDASLGHFYRNRMLREANFAEKLRITHLARRASRPATGATLRQRIVERFQASNLRLCEKWGVPAAGLDMTNLPPQSEVTFEQFFSFETQCAIQSGRVPETILAPERVERAGWMAGIEAADADVPPSEMMRHWAQQARRYRRWYMSRLAALVPFRPSSRFS